MTRIPRFLLRALSAPSLVFALCAPGVTWSLADPAKASLSVTVENLAPRGGMLRLGLYTEDTYYDDNAKPVAELDVQATPPTQTVEFADVPPGVYAIQVLQDLNCNDKMDFNILGLPLEPYGFSRDGRAFISRPDFARVKLTLGPGNNAPQIIHLQNSSGSAGPQR